MSFHPEIRIWFQDYKLGRFTRLRVCSTSNKINGKIERLEACLQKRNNVIDKVVGGL